MGSGPVPSAVMMGRRRSMDLSLTGWHEDSLEAEGTFI